MQRVTKEWIIYTAIGLLVAPPLTWLGTSLLTSILFPCPDGALLTAGGDAVTVNCATLTGFISVAGMVFFTALVIGAIVLLGIADITAAADDRF